MDKKTRLRWIGVVMLSLLMIGCAALQRKFVRRKKEGQRPVPIVTAYDYTRELRVDELYRKHLLFWKTWQTELIDKIDATYKKRIECYEQVLINLEEMKKYLNDEKAQELEGFISEIRGIDGKIRMIDLSRTERYKIQQLLEKTKRQIEKRFSYSDVKDALVFRKD